ncbi:hypothetical protein QZH41_003682 [Actinostola sp. cb2023]|nr:hypothetical protein QZH41_003682 [Actinostola sp. cb2023]
MLYNDTIAASCEDVVQVDSYQGEVEEEPVRRVVKGPSRVATEIPEYLKYLLKRCCNELNDVQREELDALLVEYSDFVTSSASNLSRTSLTKHKLNTGSRCETGAKTS